MTDISDRHMRPMDGLALPAGTTRLKVRINIAEEHARSLPGQHLLTSLVNLLCRMTDLVGSIELVGPTDVPLRVRLPNEAEGTLLESAQSLSSWAVGSTVNTSISDGRETVDVALRIGGGNDDPHATVTLVGHGRGWMSWAGTATSAPRFQAVDDPNPLGPFMAACLLASEVFKRARGVTGRGRLVEAFGYSLWSGKWGVAWDGLEDGPAIAGRRLEPLYLVGAGAVGQAFAYCLGAADLSGHVVAIDDDRHDRTNLNRCFLAGEEDDNQPKVISVERFLLAGGFETHGYQRTIGQYVGEVHLNLPQGLREAEAQNRYETVISCVDKGSSRQDLQGLWPRWIFGGSTEGLTAKTMFYDVCAGTACLACHNPPEPEGERLRYFEQQLRNLTRKEREGFLNDRLGNADVGLVLDHLEKPVCGTIGEARFREAALHHGAAFSVSFVSMAAGLLLASALLRHQLFPSVAPERPMLANLAFLNGRAIETVLAIDASCLKCGGSARQRFIAGWGGVQP